MDQIWLLILASLKTQDRLKLMNKIFFAKHQLNSHSKLFRTVIEVINSQKSLTYLLYNDDSFTEIASIVL